MTLFRVQHNKNYTVINNTICTDNRISFKAKGIWLYAFSRPDDWKFYLNDLVKQSTDKESSVSSGLKELENAGYLRRIRHRDEKGQLGASEWTFLETPSTDTFEPKPDFPILGNPILENPPLLSTDSLTSTENNNKAPDGAGVAVVVFDCLKNFQVPEHEKAWIMKNYSDQEQSIISAVAWATAPSTKITKSLEQAIKWYLKQQIKPIVGETDEERTHKLRKFSCDLEAKISSSEAKYMALGTHTEIITTTATICFDYTDRDFAEKQAKALAKYGFVKVK